MAEAMSMTKKFCPVCGKETWHNPSGKAKEGAPRCVVCGQPYGTGPKKERNEAANKARRRV